MMRVRSRIRTPASGPRGFSVVVIGQRGDEDARAIIDRFDRCQNPLCRGFHAFDRDCELAGRTGHPAVLAVIDQGHERAGVAGNKLLERRKLVPCRDAGFGRRRRFADRHLLAVGRLHGVARTPRSDHLLNTKDFALHAVVPNR